jgi:hypothetical protein
LNAINVHDPAALTAAIRSVLDRLSSRPKRIALVLPDTVGKLSLVRFEKIPAKSQDLDQLIRWQVRKAAPFKIEDAQVSWVPGIVPPEGGREWSCRRDIIEGYGACRQRGVLASSIWRRSIWSTPCSRRRAGPGRLAARQSRRLQHHGGGARIGLFPFARSVRKDDDLADLVHQTSRCIEDRLGGGDLASCWRASPRTPTPSALRRELEARLGTRDPLTSGAVALRDRIAAAPELLDLAPAIGPILRSGSRDAAGKSRDAAFYNERAIHLLVAGCRHRAVTVLNVGRSSRSRSTAQSCPRARNADRAEAAAEQRGDPHSQDDQRRARVVVSCRRRGERVDRSANLFMDGVLQSDRGHDSAGA